MLGKTQDYLSWSGKNIQSSGGETEQYYIVNAVVDSYTRFLRAQKLTQRSGTGTMTIGHSDLGNREAHYRRLCETAEVEMPTLSRN